MDWLTEFIKHLTISKTVCFALTITSAALLFGHSLLPNLIEPLDPQWKVPAIAALVFSCTLLLVWSLHAVWSFSSNAFAQALFRYRARNLTDRELAFIAFMGINGTDPLNLTIQAADASGLSKLELSQVVRSLESKGLVESGPYDENIIWLTQRGRERAIEALRRRNGQSDA